MPRLQIKIVAWRIEVSIEDLLSFKSWQKWNCLGAINNLSMVKRRSQWIENLSRIYRADREQRKLARWIEEAIELLLRWNLEILLDQETVELLSRSDLEILMDRRSVDILSRRQRAQENSSMDRRSVEVSIKAKERSLIEMESIEDLSRSYQA